MIDSGYCCFVSVFSCCWSLFLLFINIVLQVNTLFIWLFFVFFLALIVRVVLVIVAANAVYVYVAVVVVVVAVAVAVVVVVVVSALALVLLALVCISVFFKPLAWSSLLFCFFIKAKYRGVPPSMTSNKQKKHGITCALTLRFAESFLWYRDGSDLKAGTLSDCWKSQGVRCNRNPETTSVYINSTFPSVEHSSDPVCKKAAHSALHKSLNPALFARYQESCQWIGGVWYNAGLPSYN